MSEKSPMRASGGAFRRPFGAGTELPVNARPWAAVGAAMPVAAITHGLWGGSPGMVAAVGGAAAVVTYATNQTWSRRHEHTRTIATLFTGAEATWIAAATAVGPLNNSLVNAWMLGGPVMALVWNIRHAGIQGIHENDKAGDSGDKDTLFERVKALKGTRTKKIEEPAPGRLEVTAQLPAGELTPQDVQNELSRIAGALAIDLSAVTSTSVPGRADQVKIAIQPVNELASSVKWGGPSAFGKSISDAPLVPGMRADGRPLEVWIVGSDDADAPRPLPHTLTTGMTGAGKTETVATLIVDMRTRTDVVPIVADPAKFAQSFGDIADCLGLAVKGKSQVNAFIRNIPDAIEYRAQVLGDLGYKQWEPECWTVHKIPLIFIDIEEASDVLEGNEMFDEAIRKARSVGIALCASLQVATYTNIDRKTRGQFGNSLAHGCAENEDAKFALNSETRLAGADPTKWKNDAPGSLYAELVGTPRSDWATDARAFKLSRQQKRELIEASRGQWAVIDAGTMMYLSRGITMPDEQITARLPEIPEIEPKEDTEMTLILPPLPEGIDSETPLPEIPVGQVFSWKDPVDTRRKMTTEAARSLFEQRVDAIELDTLEKGDSRVTVDAREFADLPALVGRSRAWVYFELERLVEAGRLIAGNGKTYEVRPRVSELTR